MPITPEMSIKKESLWKIPLSFASVSVGTPDDLLEEKLKAISSAGFQAIELGFPDLQSFASKFHKKEIKVDDYESLCSAGEEVKKLCQKNGLGIMMLQPFSNFEGWPAESKERKDAFSRAKGWIKVMQAVGTDMLQVGSSDNPNITTSHDSLASDLRELCDLLAPHNFRLAYENWCWATVAPKWADVWSIVQKVDRPNIGLCLDTFQTTGGEYADPTTESGLIEDRGMLQKLDMNYTESLRNLTAQIPPEKIYLLQISDAYKPPAPLDPAPGEDGTRPRGRWSHDFRPYPYKEGAYLTKQCVDMAKAVLGTGSRCWFSVEVFDGKWLQDKQGSMDDFCKEAMGSVKRMIEECADPEPLPHE